MAVRTLEFSNALSPDRFDHIGRYKGAIQTTGLATYVNEELLNSILEYESTKDESKASVIIKDIEKELEQYKARIEYDKLFDVTKIGADTDLKRTQIEADSLFNITRQQGESALNLADIQSNLEKSLSYLNNATARTEIEKDKFIVGSDSLLRSDNQTFKQALAKGFLTNNYESLTTDGVTDDIKELYRVTNVHVPTYEDFIGAVPTPRVTSDPVSTAAPTIDVLQSASITPSGPISIIDREDPVAT